VNFVDVLLSLSEQKKTLGDVSNRQQKIHQREVGIAHVHFFFIGYQIKYKKA
jgi:hypothetical protein